MAGGKSKSKAKSSPAAHAQHQEVEYDEEGGETDVEDQEDEEVSTVSLQKEVKDLSAKLSQVLGAVAKLTKQVNAPSILQEAAGADSAPGSVSGDSLSSDTTVPVYSGDRLALCVGKADRNLGHPIDSGMGLSITIDKLRVFINKTLSTQSLINQLLIKRVGLSIVIDNGKIGQGMRSCKCTNHNLYAGGCQ
jgi:hypothetical protein